MTLYETREEALDFLSRFLFRWGWNYHVTVDDFSDNGVELRYTDPYCWYERIKVGMDCDNKWVVAFKTVDEPCWKDLPDWMDFMESHPIYRPHEEEVQ